MSSEGKTKLMYDICCRSNAVNITTNMQQNQSSISGNDILVAKFNYQAQENHELSISKNERLLLLDDSCPWWKVKRVDSDDIGYIPSNFARREKRSLLDKIISKRITKKANIQHGHPPPPPPFNINTDRILSIAIVKFRYDAQSEDEISLNKGLCVNVLQKKADGWWLVQNDKQRGWFPSNYLIEKTLDHNNSLSLLNQFNQQHHCPPSPVSSNGLSSSSSANSNLIEPNHVQQIRHNSHPLHINQTLDSYGFDIKTSKFAHSDGTLDTSLIQHQNSLSNEKLIDEMNRIHVKNLPIINEVWYYRNITREEAEKYLKLYGSEQGDFLIRDSERRAGNYSLSIRADLETIRHFRIEYSEIDQHYLIGKRSFKSLNDLIEHYKQHPVFDGDQTQKLYLKKALITNDLNDH